VQLSMQRDVGEPLAVKASVPTLHNIVVLARPTVCVASRRIDDEASAVASRAVDTWENEGGSTPGASDAAGDRPAVRHVTDAGPE
jgi:hypothetical protein